MPTKTLTKPASRISSRISVCLAMLSVASQAKASGKPRSSATRAGAAACRARPCVADEIVVDEIDRLRPRRLRQHGVELGDDLLGRLQPRLAAVEAGMSQNSQR